MHTDLHDALITAAMEEANSLWAIGDALVEECGPSRKQLADVAAVLDQNGFEYSVEYLAALRATAVAFPPDQRVPGVSWQVHREARSPEVLELVMYAVRTKGYSLSLRFVRERRKGLKRVREIEGW